jgi:hypothetical protein
MMRLLWLALRYRLRPAARFLRAEVKPGDVLWFHSEVPLSNESAERLRAHIDGVFPGVKVLVTNGPLTIRGLLKQRGGLR